MSGKLFIKIINSINGIILDGESLNFKRKRIGGVRLRRARTSRVLFYPKKRKRHVNICADAVQKLLDRGEIAYGITTGFGAFKDNHLARRRSNFAKKYRLQSRRRRRKTVRYSDDAGDYADSRQYSGARFFGHSARNSGTSARIFKSRRSSAKFPKREVSAQAAISRRSRIWLAF